MDVWLLFAALCLAAAGLVYITVPLVFWHEVKVYDRRMEEINTKDLL